MIHMLLKNVIEKKYFYRAMCAVGSKINVSVLGLEVDGSALCSPMQCYKTVTVSFPFVNGVPL